jgi:hypothetical protein
MTTKAEYMDYASRCKKADWYYDYSDDHSVYTRGRNEIGGLQAEAKADPIKQQLYDALKNSGWKNGPTPEQAAASIDSILQGVN